MEKKYISIGALCEAGDGMNAPELVKNEIGGSFLALSSGPWQPDALREVCIFARENRMKIQMDELISRMSGDFREDYQPFLREITGILTEYADVIDCTGMLHEYGGVRFYWPLSSVDRGATCPGKAATLEDAEREFHEVMQKSIGTLRSSGIDLPLKSVEARGLAVSHYLRCGIDKVDVEMTYQPDTEMLYSGVKGAVKAFGKDSFGVDLATLWYGGNIHDDLWFARWKMSLYHAFIRGADPIYAEHGICGFKNVLGNSAAENSPTVVKFRKILSDFTKFAAANPRPEGLPEAAVAVMQGRLDGYAGADQTHIWGIREDDRFLVGDAEYSWELFHALYRRRAWHNRETAGSADLSGNPPLGQADIIPYDITDEALASYKAVILLGRNVMDDALYERLLRYVKNGGQLLLAAAHLDSNTAPDGKFIPFRQGNWEELCGVTLKSDAVTEQYGIKFRQVPEKNWNFPLWTAVCDPKFPGRNFRCADMNNISAELLAAASRRFNDQDLEVKADSGSSATLNSGADAENLAWKNLEKHGMIFAKKLGRGCTVLVNSLAFPGTPGVKELYAFLMDALCDAHRSYPALEAADPVRFAVYPGTPRTLYILNTETDLEQSIIIHWNKNQQEQRKLAPGELLILPVIG